MAWASNRQRRAPAGRSVLFSPHRCQSSCRLTPCLPSAPQIFATTRKEDAAGGDGGKRKEGGSKGGGAAGGGAAKKFKPYSKKTQTEAELEAQQFRDRAKERRLGTSKEYAISEEAVRSLTVEESKYLGGDMEHTHLVKGLDFALLAKVRAEMEQKEDERDEELDKALDEALGKLEANTQLGKSVRGSILAPERRGRKNIDMFLPGRTTFAFDLDDDFGSDIPTAISRSIDDLKFTNRDKKTANINKTIMTSISTIMAYIRQGSKPASKKRLKLKEKDSRNRNSLDGEGGGGSAEKAAALQQPKVVAPEEDIFDDAGEYDLSMRASEDVK